MPNNSPFTPKTLKDRLWDLLEPVARHYGLDLFDLIVLRRTHSALVRVMIDNPAGELTIDDCEKVHRHMELALDTSGLVGTKYSLEVGTPGLDRPLRSVADFMRFAGRLAKVVFQPGHEPASALGTIAEVKGEYITLRQEDDTTITFRWDEISRAHLEVEMFREKKSVARKKHG
jgi:ribosome maturation factor RimP